MFSLEGSHWPTFVNRAAQQCPLYSSVRRRTPLRRSAHGTKGLTGPKSRHCTDACVPAHYFLSPPSPRFRPPPLEFGRCIVTTRNELRRSLALGKLAGGNCGCARLSASLCLTYFVAQPLPLLWLPQCLTRALKLFFWLSVLVCCPILLLFHG